MGGLGAGSVGGRGRDRWADEQPSRGWASGGRDDSKERLTRPEMGVVYGIKGA